MSVLVDPSFLLTIRRGPVWIQRARKADVPVYSSASVIDLVGAADAEALENWTQGWGRFGYSDAIVSPAAAMCFGVHVDPFISQMQIDTASDAESTIVGELISGMLAGHTLVARKYQTLNALADSGLIVLLHGRRDAAAAAESLLGLMDRNLGDSLLRRVRFLCRIERSEQMFADIFVRARIVVHAYDLGPHSFR